MKNNLLCLIAFLLMFSVLGVANAAPVQWSGNGHYYDWIGEVNHTWDTAKAAAEAKNGYLVTPTSAAENDFLIQNFDVSFCWLGGYQTPGGNVLDENWNWVTGEAWNNYTNWEASNPDDWDGTTGGVEDGEEDTLLFVHGVYPNSWAGQWNDAPADTMGTYGYIIEYDTNPVPIPGALWLLGSGLIAMLGIRRRG